LWGSSTCYFTKRIQQLESSFNNRLLSIKSWYKGSIVSTADQFQNPKIDWDLIYILHTYNWVCSWIFAKLISVKIILNVKLIMFKCLLLKSKFDVKVKLRCTIFNLKQSYFLSNQNLEAKSILPNTKQTSNFTKITFDTKQNQSW